MQKIFIVEDDPSIVKFLKKALLVNFQVKGVQSFRAVLQEILEFDADLVLMDIRLPFFSGFYWTTELRKGSEVPIIFISSTGDEMNQIMAMNQGADDFVTKPFSVEILVAKIKALLRRSYAFKGAEKLEFAGFQLKENTLSDGVKLLELTTSESKILTVLFRAEGEIISKEKLLQALWQTDEFIDVNTLNVKMSRLKRKLEKIGFDDHIKTKRGAGYGLT
ncbi:response regulator transcription factor [Lactovum miscens]|uniref:DNA-binding response OmpR family regulator n=1 Tax=Lactovum miscens TaxID=190387 RepID=A0A841C4N3_9LACT|nr:response regulator transcription factor [Lactovum miscens]MBB5887375.1 DNA-binding response OmpR family regulator [Lactovum miscens]